MFDLKSMGVMAIFAGVASVWSQIKNFMIRFKSVFIITASIDDVGLKCAFEGILKEKFKKSKFGSITFAMTNAYIKKDKRYRNVAYSQLSSAMTYWDGIKPMFVSFEKANGKGDGDKMTVTFIRGTFDIRELIKESVDRENLINSENNKEDIRFRIKDFYGSYGSEDVSSSNKSVSEEGLSLSYLKNLDLIGCELKDIGQDKPEDPFENLYYNDEVNDFIKKLDRFMSSKEHFSSRGLDWRMGMEIKGPPGTGKSSFVKAIGQKYNLPVYRFDLISMSNEELNGYWNQALNNVPCICLFEDLDRLYNDKQEMINSDTMQTKGKLTTDALLNCISGVKDSNGIISIATANHPEKLPDALTRDGRLDVSLELGFMTTEGQRKMAWRIINGTEVLCLSETLEDFDCELSKTIEKLIENNKEITGARFQSICTKVSLDKYWGR